MLSIIKNDWLRIKEQKKYLIVAAALTVCSVIMAVILTNTDGLRSNLAVIGEIPGQAAWQQDFNITELDKVPELSQLVQGEYDAAVRFEGGEFEITTVKSEDFRSRLQAELTARTSDAVYGESNASEQPGRGIGTNLLGYMLMFLMMQGVVYGRMFAEDKEKHQIERIVCSPINFSSYLGGHVLFIWGLIFVPAAGMLSVLKLAGIQLGLGLWQHVLLLALAAFLSAGFSMCINAFVCSADTANMVGSCVVVLTSVLSGTFFDMGGVDGWLKTLVYVLPQKSLMIFVEGWEQHLTDKNTLTALFYVILCAGIFLCVGILKTRKDYVYLAGKHTSVSIDTGQ